MCALASSGSGFNRTLLSSTLALTAALHFAGELRDWSKQLTVPYTLMCEQCQQLQVGLPFVLVWCTRAAAHVPVTDKHVRNDRRSLCTKRISRPARCHAASAWTSSFRFTCECPQLDNLASMAGAWQLLCRGHLSGGV